MLTRERVSHGLCRGALLVASVAAACLLAGCDQGSSNAEAQAAADKAAQIQQSAGKARATDKLYDTVVEKGDDIKSLESGINESKYKDWVTQQSAAKDLETAEKTIKAITTTGLAPGMKATVESTTGNIQLQLAADRFTDVQPKIAALVEESILLQQEAGAAMSAARQSSTLALGIAPPSRDDLNAAQTNLVSMQRAAQAAKAKVDDIEKQIADKQSQAKDIYIKTDQAFADADKIKGKAAIEVGNKAMQDRSQGDQLSQEAALLEPDLIKAKAELAAALIQQKNAESRVQSATEILNAGTASAQENARQQEILHEQARALVNGDSGVNAHYAKMLELYAQIEGELQKSAEAAKQAQTSYVNAQLSYAGVQKDLATKLGDSTERNDPLKQTVEDKRVNAMLAWSQATASQQLGRIHLTGYMVSGILSTASGLSNEACRSAGEAANAKLPNMPNYKADATAAFNDAVTASDVTKWTGEAQKLQWIGLSIRAAANQGLALLSDGETRKKFFAAAAENATAAIKSNPDMAPLARGVMGQ